MAAVKSRDTKPELALRQALSEYGLRYRVHVKSLIGRPDIAFLHPRVAIFVDGEYWHGKGWRARGYRSLEDQFAHWRRGDWWLAKVRANVARDRRQTRQLRRDGWTVLRFGEAAIAKSLDRCVSRILRALHKRKA